MHVIMALDNETGEIIKVLDPFVDTFLDSETGECVGEVEFDEKVIDFVKKKKFHVPKFYLHQPVSRKKVKHCLDTKQTFTLSSKKRVINLKEVR